MAYELKRISELDAIAQIVSDYNLIAESAGGTAGRISFYQLALAVIAQVNFEGLDYRENPQGD